MDIILKKIFLGISLAMPIGPVCAEMIKRGLSRGFCSAFSIRLGGAIANSICLILAYFGFSYFLQSPFLLKIIAIFGILLLTYMGCSNILKSNVVVQPNATDNNGLWLGFILALTSPIGLMFWLGQGGCIDCPLGIQFFIVVGVLLWGAIFSLCLHFGSLIMRPKVLRAISIMSGIFMIYIACSQAYKIFINY